MKTPQTRLIVAAMAICFPVLVFAQAVVPPPLQPGTVSSAPSVAPPVSVTSANPAAAVQAPPAAPPVQTLIDIALPDVPKKPVADMTPKAPGAERNAKTRKASPKKADDVELVKPIKVDPFSGLAVTPVSDSQLNRFVFPEPVEGIYFSEGAPLPECPEKAGPQDPCKPVFLNGKKLMLLQLRAGAKGPVQMLAHLASGRVITFNLAPAAGPGALVRVEGAEDGASDSRLAASAKLNAEGSAEAGGNASEKNVAMLSRFAAGDIPAGFDSIAVGKPIRFEHFDVVPQATWDNGANLRAHLFSVEPHGNSPVLINASLFRNANVRALALDRDTITKAAPAQLYLLEYVPSENK